MKQLLMSITLLSLWMLNAEAQKNKMEIGIEGGANFSLLKGNKYVSRFNPALAYSEAAFVRFTLKSNFTVKSTIGFERKSVQQSIESIDIYGQSLGRTKIFESFDYLTCPVLLQYSFGNKIKPCISGGVYASYLIKQNEISNSSEYYLKMIFNHTSIFKRFDMGIAGRAGALISLSEALIISIEAGDNLGFHKALLHENYK